MKGDGVDEGLLSGAKGEGTRVSVSILSFFHK